MWELIFCLIYCVKAPENTQITVTSFRRKSLTQCFEVSCPAEINVNAKENEKVQKSLLLLSDMSQLYLEMLAEVVSLVISQL